ncbi:glycosyltransferase family 4 protein [Mesorhizobium sp. BR1-1-14]|uniref:glycosyltransferase family 4 protein n=1 Tax=Mesorhizobium sp. BR1-1-14 TaxID=2876655 RepID=UPI001CD11A3E|nr:glycosyltransferase family 4 protein [Mesorhizobium sp. BR1-1-14]MBZ9957183.1 glycosyltransferase family 4 protein [Mesorhizobium sp. BR1-1-14]
MVGGASQGPIRVCFPFIGDDVGGSHISALKLIQNLDTSKVVPVLVLQETAGPLAAFLQMEGQPFTGFPLPTTSPGKGTIPGDVMTYLTSTLPRMRRFIKEQKFDIVHTNDGRTHVNWGIAARLAGARLVWHHRGDPDAKGANALAPLIAHRMVTVSRFSRPRHPIRSLKGRLSVIHSPFDHPSTVPDRIAAKATLLDELGLAPGTRVLSFIGGLIERKRPLLFIDILDRFVREHPQIPVVGCVFGNSPAGSQDLEAAARVRCAERGLGQTVRFMGFRNPIEPFLAATDVLVVPAMGEPFGRTLIEAMFLGTPVVATDHGGNPEAIENGRTGFLVTPEDAGAFMEPLSRLLSNPPLWARISDAARDHAFFSYSTHRHVENVMKTYDRALCSRKAGLATDLTSEIGG